MNLTGSVCENQSSQAVVDSFNVAQLTEFCDRFAVQIFYGTSFASFALQILFVIVGVLRNRIFDKYAVGKEEVEKTSSILLNWQIKCHWIISFLWITEGIVRLVFFRNNNITESMYTITRGIVIWPLLTYIFQYNESYKFSSPSKLEKYFSLKHLWITCLVLDILGSVCHLFLWGDVTTGQRLGVGFSLVRSLALWGIIYLYWQTDAKKTDSNDENENKTNKNEEDEDWKYKSFEEKIEIVRKQWSSMGTCFKLNAKVKVSIGICLLSIAVESILQIYSDIVVKDLLNSVSSLSARNGTQDNSTSGFDGSFEIRFRWDLLLIQTVLHFLIYDIVRLLKSYAWDTMKTEVDVSNQTEMYQKIQNMSLRWHLEKKTGDTLGILRYGSQTFFSFFNYLFMQVLPEWIGMIIYFVYVSAVYPRVLNIIICLTTVGILTVHLIVTQYEAAFDDEEMEADNQKMSDAIEAISNFETVKYFTNENFEEQKFTSSLKTLEAQQFKRRWLNHWSTTGQSLVRLTGSFLGSLLCYWMVYNNEGLTMGDYHMFGSHIYQFYYPFMGISYLYSTFLLAVKDMVKVTTLLQEKIEVEDSPNAKELVIAPEGGDIVFDNVQFSYVPERKIIHGISFTVPAGKTYALVGETGCGKSTLMRLLFRFYDVDAGTIRIGGQDISTVSLSSLRSAIGVIPQDTVLFHQSLKDNILYGNLATANPDKDIRTAAKCACIHEKIETFPDKYETIVGSRGLKLSGGERQRISIARAVLKNAPILLMDEATSSLDSQTEREIQKTLETVCKSRTTLMIAHRLSTIVNADKIIVLHEGRVVESGSHAELLKQGGKYAETWNEQLHVQSE